MNELLVTSRIDRIGAGESFLCAIHCMLMPLIVTVLPFIGHSFLTSIER